MNMKGVKIDSGIHFEHDRFISSYTIRVEV